jgi:hypothetical protein
MNREDIIKLAREAEIDELMQMMPRVAQKIERFAALVAAAEREACAKVADKYHVPMCESCADAIADSIRARGQA